MRARLGHAALFAAIAGCGRVHFDPLSSGDAGGDGVASDALDSSLILRFPFDTGTDDVITGSAPSCVGSCPLLMPGKLGMAASFDGTGCLSIPSTSATQPATFTLSLWINRPTYGEFSVLAKPFDPALTDFDSFQIEDHTNLQLGFTTHNLNRHDILFTTTPVTGAWHHIAMTFDGGTKRIYRDGAPAMNTPETDSVGYDASPIFIGCDMNTGNMIVFRYVGMIDELRLYSRALSDAEVATLAQ